MSANSDAIDAVTAQLLAVEQQFPAAVAAALAAAAASGDPAIGPSITALQTQANATIAALQASLPKPPPPPALSVSPASISSAPGAAISQALSVSGGTAPYAFASSLADVSVDASGNVTGTPAAAETGTITVTDASSPALTASVSVTIT